MLDVLDPVPADEFLAAVQAWQPDAACLAAGDEYTALHHVALAIRCYVAAGLSDRQIIDRVLRNLDTATDVDTAPEHWNAAMAVARHCALMDMPLNHIIAVLAYLAVEVPCFPDADDRAEIAEAALRECAV
jgi:hypothetical protein